MNNKFFVYTDKTTGLGLNACDWSGWEESDIVDRVSKSPCFRARKGDVLLSSPLCAEHVRRRCEEIQQVGRELQ